MSPYSNETQRPDWLMARLRTMSVDEHSGPRFFVVRQPKGPDGTRGFKLPRSASISNGKVNGDAANETSVHA